MSDSRDSLHALTPKQKRFLQEYLTDLNATQAAVRSGYSPKTARSIGAENLTKPNIAAAIREAQVSLAKRTQVDQEFVVDALMRLAEPRIDDPDPQQANVAVRALELLGRTLGIFVDRKEVMQAGKFEITIQRVEPDGTAENEGLDTQAG